MQYGTLEQLQFCPVFRLQTSHKCYPVQIHALTTPTC